eukprot:SM000090S24305  [mRNA]  locus=s90:151377:160912:- [translate_table: standard]
MAATCRADGALPAIVARVQRAAASRAAFVPAAGAEAAAHVPRFQAAAALARAAAGLLAGFVGFLAVAVFFRAPMSLSNAHATASWALLMASTVCVHGAVLLGPSKDDLRRVFLAFEPWNERERVAIALALGTTVGCWFGAWPMPLDWDKPWQARNTYPNAAGHSKYGPGEMRLWTRSAVEQSSGRIPGRAEEVKQVAASAILCMTSASQFKFCPTSSTCPQGRRRLCGWSRRVKQRCPSQSRHKACDNHQPGGRRARGGSGGGGSDGCPLAERGASLVPEAFLLVEHSSHRARNETWEAATTQLYLAQYSIHAAP